MEQAGDTGGSPPWVLKSTPSTPAGIEMIARRQKIFSSWPRRTEIAVASLSASGQKESRSGHMPNLPHACVPVVSRLGECWFPHGCNSQSNQGWCHFHFIFIIILVELPC